MREKQEPKAESPWQTKKRLRIWAQINEALLTNNTGVIRDLLSELTENYWASEKLAVQDILERQRYKDNKELQADIDRYKRFIA